MEIPDFLLTQIREGKAVLVLGAGASMGATDQNGKGPPVARTLALALADRYLGGAFRDAGLSQVSEYAISESSLTDVQDFVTSVFIGLEPAPFHKIIPTFRWHGLATTNYDLVIEKAYLGAGRSALQRLHPIIDNTDRIEDCLRDPSCLPFLKLHGCVTRTSAAAAPLILTTDQYVQYRIGRSRLFDQLYLWAYERPLVFLGHSIQDSDLRALLLDLAAQNTARTRSYVVAPDLTDIHIRFWETKKITGLNGTAEEFLRALDGSIPSAGRVLAGLLVTQETLPIAERFSKRDYVLSETARNFLTLDVEYVKRVTASSVVDPRDFYKGLNPGWAAIEQNLDAQRRLADTVISDIVLADTHPDRVELVAMKGYAGAGKSVLMRRIAWESSRDYDALCLYVRPQGAISAAALREVIAACDQRVYLFVDDVADRTREVAGVIRDMRSEGARLTLIVAERVNEWNVSCSSQLDPLVTTEYLVPYLDGREIEELLQLLTRHKALGTLESASQADRRLAFAERAGRQLLVALHEATLGHPFEDIIEDEYQSIVPAEARDIYLSICVLNRLSVDVRAGLISRLHDIPFDEFKRRFFGPLEHVVYTAYSPLIRDHTYSARHPHVAEMVFARALRNAEDRFDKYIKCLQALNLGYRSDERAFRQMVRGRVVHELFPNQDMARALFAAAESQAGPSDAFLLQQMALYELNRPGGNLERAGALLERAATSAPNDASIRHSRAEYLLRLAESARTPLEREQRLRESHRIAQSLRSDRNLNRLDGSPAFHTLAKIGLRRLESLLPDETTDTAAVEAAIKEVETQLSEGLQRYPGDSYLLDAEADLAALLRDSVRALNAMQTAFKANPRSGVIAARLARTLAIKGEGDAAMEVLKKAVDANPGDRRLHLALGKMLVEKKPGHSDEIEYHLTRSFTEGDSNYEGRLLYARQLFISGKAAEAKAAFKELGNARVSPSVRQRAQYPLLGSWEGRVTRLEATYAFAARDGSGDWIFIHRGDVAEGTWSTLRVDTRVRFEIAFTMKGPVAVGVTLAQS